MTEFFAFETLTWPEVASLPRNTPLVLPCKGLLGELPTDPSPGASSKAFTLLAEALGQPDRVGILPELPYGWRDSGLVVPDAVFYAFCANLLNSMIDDGFNQVYLLATRQVRQDLDGRLRSAGVIALPEDTPFKSKPFAPEADSRKVVLVPAGHTEQHAFHLPLNTDTLIIDALCDGVVAQIPERATRLPVMPYGVSTHRSSYAGTFNAGGRAFEDFFLAVVNVLAERGYRKMYLLSGHGGNCSFFTSVVKYAGEWYPRSFIATTWLYLSGPSGVASLEARRDSACGGMGHAGELETSLILHLRPDLVHMQRVVDEVDFITTPSYYMDWVEGGSLVANPPWEDDTSTGAYGAGSLGTAEKGAFWLQAAVEEKVAHVGEIEEQWARRNAKK